VALAEAAGVHGPRARGDVTLCTTPDRVPDDRSDQLSTELRSHPLHQLLEHAAAFLRWLSEHSLALSTCRQTDIDAWHVEHNQHGRNTLRATRYSAATREQARASPSASASLRRSRSLGRRLGLIWSLRFTNSFCRHDDTWHR